MKEQDMRDFGAYWLKCDDDLRYVRRVLEAGRDMTDEDRAAAIAIVHGFRVEVRKEVAALQARQAPQPAEPTLSVERWKGDTAPGQYRPIEGTWELRSPDGTSWHESSPIACLRAEQRDRIPAQVALARIYESLDEDSGEFPTGAPPTGEGKP